MNTLLTVKVFGVFERYLQVARTHRTIKIILPEVLGSFFAQSTRNLYAPTKSTINFLHKLTYWKITYRVQERQNACGSRVVQEGVQECHQKCLS